MQLIEKHDLAFHSEQFRILTAQALFSSGNTNACIGVLEKNLLNPLENEVLSSSNLTVAESDSYYRGLRFLLLARAYESLENKLYAVQFYKEALRYNSACFEAFNRLVANHLLTREEKRALFEEGGALSRNLQGEDLWLKDYYVSRIEQEIRGEPEGYMAARAAPAGNQTSLMANTVSRGDCSMGSGLMSSPSRFQHDLLLENIDDEDMRLRNPAHPEDRHEVCVIEAMQTGDIAGSFDIRLIEAEKLFRQQNYGKAYDVIKAVVEADFYYVHIVPLYCGVLIELNKVGELYYLAHKLVSANPDLAVAWFAVGSYYFLIKKFDLARKYFNKANRLDKHFAASWIAFGHAFAAQDESD